MKHEEVVRVLKDMLEDMQTLQRLPSPDKSLKYPQIVQIEALSTAIEWGKENAVLWNNYEEAMEDRRTLKAENARLKEELEDINDTYKVVMEDKGASDEQHCGCVMHLRRRIKELESIVSRVDDVKEIENTIFRHMQDAIDPEYVNGLANALHSWLKGEK